MKKIKIIPAVALVALMSGCTTNENFSMKKPSFTKQGSEVTYSEFTSNYLEAKSKVDFFNEDAYVAKDGTQSESSFIVVKDSLKDGKKTINSSIKKYLDKEETKFDVDNSVLSEKRTHKEYKEAKGPSINDKKTYFADINTTYQPGKVENENMFLKVNELTKEYSPSKFINETHTVEDVFTSLVYDTLTDLFSYNTLFDVEMSEEDQAKYKFYKNGTVFTCVRQTSEETENKTSDLVVWGTTTVKTYHKFQIDLKPGAVKAKAVFETSSKTVSNIDNDNYPAGFVYEVSDIEYIDYSMAYKNVDLKAKDLSNYRFVDNRG